MNAQNKFPPVFLTVDCVLLTLLSVDGSKKLAVVVQRRPKEPFKEIYGLPGSYVHADADDSLEATARRILRSKLNVFTDKIYLEQLYTVSSPTRDPRGWSASVVYYALVQEDEINDSLSLVCDIYPVNELPPLAYDHASIIKSTVDRIRSKSLYSNIPAKFLNNEFTIGELMHAYETILDEKLDQSVFRRRMSELKFIEPVHGLYRRGGQHRPSQLYRIGCEGIILSKKYIQQRRRD